MRRWMMLVLGSMLVSGCTFSAVTAARDATRPAPSRPRHIVLGHVTVADPAWQSYRPEFADGFVEWFTNNPGVPDALADRGAEFPADAVMLIGTITDVDEGSWPLRWFVGMGAGRARIEGDFQILDANGNVLTGFSARESYLGGPGLRGPGFLSIDDLVRRFGATVAKSARKWANGEPVG